MGWAALGITVERGLCSLSPSISYYCLPTRLPISPLPNSLWLPLTPQSHETWVMEQALASVSMPLSHLFPGPALVSPVQRKTQSLSLI